MTDPVLALEGVTFILPDGRVLFSGLDAVFDQRPTGLVGRNGAGKTVLARILDGELQPSAGRCVRNGRVHYLSQQVAELPGQSVAGLMGLQAALDALGRIEAGSSDALDFEALGERWDLRQRMQAELQRCGLGHLAATTPSATLSGGEAMRVALAGAMLSGADLLILDEPTNHLDRDSRQALMTQLARCGSGLLVISHDRQLLESMARILELSESGLHAYGGGYSHYVEQKAQAQQAALDRLDAARGVRRRQERELREHRERMERRQASDRRRGREANQAKILLGARKARSEGSMGKLRRAQDAARDVLEQQVREAAARIDKVADISLHSMPAEGSARRAARLSGLQLPFVPAATRHIDLVIEARWRIGVTGPNGCGKSTLLKVLAGQLPPLAGRSEVNVPTAFLDQRLADLDPRQPLIEQMLAANPTATEAQLRMQLAHAGLDAGRISIASGKLSGGERLKAALALALYADPPAQLLLLDEPGNHLDLPSLQALEAMLRDYQGALLVVAHDDVFLDNLDLTHRLVVTQDGWLLEPWRTAEGQD